MHFLKWHFDALWIYDYKFSVFTPYRYITYQSLKKFILSFNRTIKTKIGKSLKQYSFGLKPVDDRIEIELGYNRNKKIEGNIEK